MKRKLIMLVVLLMVAVISFAQEVTGVRMIGYEQSYLDRKATIALKNETDETIRNVSFQLIYSDMSDQPMDYKDFHEKVEIEPGMVKKLDIEAYERMRNYEYYKSASEYGSHQKFKVQFKLKAVNEPSFLDIDPDDTFFYFGMLILAVVLVLGNIGLFMIVGFMAKRRSRSVLLWLLISLFITPFLCIFVLLAAGDSSKENFKIDRGSDSEDLEW